MFTAVVTAFVILVFSIVVTHAASPRFTATQLRPLVLATGTYVSVYDINDAGMMIGEQTTLVTSGGSRRPDLRKSSAVLWSANGTPTGLATPRQWPGDTTYVGTSATRLNNAGAAIGKSYSSNGTIVSTAWDAAGTPTLLNQLQISQAIGINDLGVIAGLRNGRPVVLKHGVVTEVKMGSFSNGWVADINNSGAMVGQLWGQSYTDHPYRLATEAAPVSLLPASGSEGFVGAINQHGVAVGSLRVPAGSYQLDDATRFVDGQTQSLGKLPSTDPRNSSRAYALNDRGDVVGVSGVATFSAEQNKTVLWRDGEIIDLHLATDGPLPLGFQAIGINNRGQIIGNVFTDHDADPATPRENLAIRLDPIRTPGDTNYDNAVNFGDLLTLAKNYGKTGNGNVFWESGDFNYDWSVNFNDLLTLAQSYGTGGPSLAGAAGVDSAFVSDWALAQSLVPEPACVSALFIATAFTARRRRPMMNVA